MKSFVSFILLSMMIKSTFAQLQARDEPRHKNVFENKWLRILDVNIKPGDTTLFHRHSTPSVIVILTNTKIGTQLQGGEPVISQGRPGNMSYAAYGEKPIFHHVWNDDTSMFHVMDIELLGKNENPGEPAEGGPGFEPGWQEKMVNTYSISLKENENITNIRGSHPLLIINISGRTFVQAGNKERISLIKPGQFIWIDPGTPLQMGCISNGGSKLVSLELK
jgi:quercetin dioxygenase-like cupin family protein